MGLNAQNTFFPTTVGTVQIYVQKNFSGKVDGYSRRSVLDVKKSGDDMTVSYSIEMLDKNQKSKNPPETFPCKALIKGDVVTFDIHELFASMQKEAQNEFSVDITGVPLELSSKLKPGDKIKDSEMKMTIDMIYTKMVTTVFMTNGKCEAIEDVTVPAGTFKCHKITQKANTKMMDMNVPSASVTWYALGIGIVKSESYDDRNRLISSTELASHKK
jgi:hypothetical protein